MVLLPMIAAAVAAAPVAPISAMDLADSKCIAIIALMAGKAQDETQKTGLASGLMYYIGRIDARTPGFDFSGQIIRLFNDKTFMETQIKPEAQRCGAEMTAKGKEVQAFGDSLKQAAQKQGG